MAQKAAELQAVLETGTCNTKQQPCSGGACHTKQHVCGLSWEVVPATMMHRAAHCSLYFGEVAHKTPASIMHPRHLSKTFNITDSLTSSSSKQFKLELSANRPKRWPHRSYLLVIIGSSCFNVRSLSLVTYCILLNFVRICLTTFF